jgi:hypothetical protein
MNKLVPLLILLSHSLTVFSQNDSILMNRLNENVVTCETLAFNCQALLPEYHISQPDTIRRILSIWENECGNVEPILRLKILLDIKDKSLIDTAQEVYLTHYIYIFKDRLSLKKKLNYHEIFDSNKPYFSYVPLRSEFDEWTKTIAENLLIEQEKGSSEYLFCLLFSEKADLFYEELKLKEYQENHVKKTVYEEKYDTWQRGMVYNVILGAWIPAGNLSNTFGVSPNLGFRVGYTLENLVRFDVGVNVRIHTNSKPFEIFADSSISSVKSNTGITAGIWLAKEYRLKNQLMIDAFVGAGIGIIDTDLQKSRPKPDSNSNYYSIQTADFSIGLNIRKRIFIKNSIGINMSYHFAPYKLDDILVHNIGNQFFTTNLIYRF